MLSKCQAFVNFSVIWGLSSMIFGGKAQDRIIEACTIDMVISWLHVVFFDGNIRFMVKLGGLIFYLSWLWCLSVWVFFFFFTPGA